jgi:hypothetical protein
MRRPKLNLEWPLTGNQFDGFNGRTWPVNDSRPGLARF